MTTALYQQPSAAIFVPSEPKQDRISVSSHEKVQTVSISDDFYGLITLSGMSETTVPMSQFVADCLSRLDHVQAVLAGHSADVLHVWTMVDEWKPEHRKQVYSIQKLIMKRLEGLHFDFYVIDLPHGMRPEEMVTGIPVIFNRATKRTSHSDS